MTVCQWWIGKGSFIFRVTERKTDRATGRTDNEIRSEHNRPPFVMANKHHCTVPMWWKKKIFFHQQCMCIYRRAHVSGGFFPERVSYIKHTCIDIALPVPFNLFSLRKCYRLPLEKGVFIETLDLSFVWLGSTILPLQYFPVSSHNPQHCLYCSVRRVIHVSKAFQRQQECM